MKTLIFKIAIKGVVYTVSLLELQALQIKRINYRYVIGG